ncbi:hypothetical protein CsSME_00002274 [Camellia sinensis var. sinensis]
MFLDLKGGCGSKGLAHEKSTTAFAYLVEVEYENLWRGGDADPTCVWIDTSMFSPVIEIQLKSPNWLFGQRKYEESNCAPKVASQETANGRCQDEKRVDGLCDLKWLSFSGDVNEKDVFKSIYLFNPKGCGLVGEEGNQRAYHPGGRRAHMTCRRRRNSKPNPGFESRA